MNIVTTGIRPKGLIIKTYDIHEELKKISLQDILRILKRSFKNINNVFVILIIY